jgi:hypothetical protein
VRGEQREAQRTEDERAVDEEDQDRGRAAACGILGREEDRHERRVRVLLQRRERREQVAHEREGADDEARDGQAQEEW